MTDNVRQRYIKTDNLTDPQDAYQAWGLTGNGRRAIGLHLWYEDGLSSEVIYYLHLKRVVSTSDELIALMTGDWVYILRGQRLNELPPHMCGQKIDFLQAFNADKHAPPSADAPVIDSIEVVHNEEWWDYYKGRREALRSAHLTLVADNRPGES